MSAQTSSPKPEHAMDTDDRRNTDNPGATRPAFLDRGPAYPGESQADRAEAGDQGDQASAGDPDGTADDAKAARRARRQMRGRSGNKTGGRRARRKAAEGEADAALAGADADASLTAAALTVPADDETKRNKRKKRERALRAAERKVRPQPPVREPARPAGIQRRHVGIAVSFLLLVVAPIAVCWWYLYHRAADQYASYLGFSVRSEAGPVASDLVGGLSSLVGMTSSSSSDTDILYKFIQSRDLVERVSERLDLREIWSKVPDDPVFRYGGGESLEALLSEWERKVTLYYDDGMIDLRVLAFDPVDARDVAQAIFDESSELINELNDIAREDALRYSRNDLDEAQTRLKEARQAVTQFRNRHQLVDPTADVQGQVGVVTSLQQSLAEQLVSLGLLQANAQPNDPRIAQTQLTIDVIRQQIEDERQKFGSETPTGELLSDLVGQYETLSVDREFAERTYTAALAAYDTARAEAARQSRYLAAYVKPQLAQQAEYPERAKLMVIIGGFVLVIWVIGVLIFYSLRDRR